MGDVHFVVPLSTVIVNKITLVNAASAGILQCDCHRVGG